MMKMLRVSTAVSAVLVLSSLTSLTAADDDFSWGNLFGQCPSTPFCSHPRRVCVLLSVMLVTDMSVLFSTASRH